MEQKSRCFVTVSETRSAQHGEENLDKPASNAMFASGVNPIKTAGGNGTYMPKPFLSETTLCSGRLSTIIILRE